MESTQKLAGSGIMGHTTVVRVSAIQRQELEAIVARSSEAAGLVRRARVILLSAGEVSDREIARRLDLSAEAVSRIRTRFRAKGVAGLQERPKAGRKDHAVPQPIVEKIVQLAMSPPPPGRSRWTTRLLGKEVGLTGGCVSDVLRRCRARRHTHDYKRHGVVDLYAALEIGTGQVTHQVSDSHTAVDFLVFMNKVVRAYPSQELHVVLDNSSSHATPAVKTWLDQHPRVRFHFTPTSASWLNQVEGFFGVLAKQSLSETDFPTKKALREHLAAYMRSGNKNPTPFAWTKPAQSSRVTGACLIASQRRCTSAPSSRCALTFGGGK